MHTIHLLDEKENILAASRTKRASFRGVQKAELELEVDSAVRHRFYGMSAYAGGATFRPP